MLFLHFASFATGDSTCYLLHTDSVFLSVNTDGEKIITHTLEKKQTLYSLAKFYGLHLQELLVYNPELRDASIKLGQEVKIPIPNRAIHRYRAAGHNKREFARLYYVVKKGDTMYRIAKVYFKMPISIIQERNGLSDIELRTGQLLHIGWISTKGVSENARKSGGPIFRKSEQLRIQYLEQSIGKKSQEERGPARWDKNEESGTELSAKHPSAKKGTILKITNPWNNKTVYVKVTDSIPQMINGKETTVQLSATAARYLGAIDSRFYVYVEYAD